MLNINNHNISKILKQDEYVTVYMHDSFPNEVCKNYDMRYGCMSSNMLKTHHNRMLAMKKKNDWPEFLIKPSYVGKIKDNNFTFRMPFVSGRNLQQIMFYPGLDLKSIALIIKKLEEYSESAKNIIITDIANPNNIMIGEDKKITIIDPDDVQFDDYLCHNIISLVCPNYEQDTEVFGYYKCHENGKFNKQLEIRSMYALLYFLINPDNQFYPAQIERRNISEYEQLLDRIALPKNSSLYKKSLETIEESTKNKPVGDSLMELVDDGYELVVTVDSDFSYAHKLIKR